MSHRLPIEIEQPLASLAFGVHCSVFKKRISDERVHDRGQ
jgi:hypothetical protein